MAWKPLGGVGANFWIFEIFTPSYPSIFPKSEIYFTLPCFLDLAWVPNRPDAESVSAAVARLEPVLGAFSSRRRQKQI